MKSKQHRRGRASRGIHTPSQPSYGADERKTQQLCRQVQRRIDLVLGELDDECFAGLWVLEVNPEPGSSALLVTLVAPDERDVMALNAKLDEVKGLLRSEVAAAIHRKRTPHLRLAVIPERALLVPGEVQGD